MDKIIIWVLLFFTLNTINGQDQQDTIYNWKQKFATLDGIPVLSSTGKWLAVKKFYRKKPDTIFVINTLKKDLPAKKLLCSGVPEFLNDEGIMARSGNKIDYLNLNLGQKLTVDSIKNAFLLQKSSNIVILKSDGIMQIYNSKGEKQLDIKNIDGQPVTDKKTTIFAKRTITDGTEILAISQYKAQRIYITKNEISSIQMLPSGEKLVIQEFGLNEKTGLLTVLEVDDPHKKSLELQISLNSEITFTEIKDKQFYLITTKLKSHEEKEQVVELWYGNDSFLKKKSLKTSHLKHYIWNTTIPKVTEVKLDSPNQELISLNSTRYFLSYLPRNSYNYITAEPELNDIKIYDIENKVYKSLGNLKKMSLYKKGWRKETINEEVIISPDGHYFIASQDGEKWTLYNINGDKISTIDQEGLEYPVFSLENDRIFFESQDDLWDYHLKTGILKSLHLGTKKMTRIKNKNFSRVGPTAISCVDPNKILIENYDFKENMTYYSLLKKGKQRTIIPPTKNKISVVLTDPQMNHFLSLEENYNLPPRFYNYTNGKKELLFDGYIKDKKASQIRQKILSYQALGKNLNGTLYYPQNYVATNKYPMIVDIYEVQWPESNEYLSPDKGNLSGPQVRTLVELGYFVLLPDINYGTVGPGKSALISVNEAVNVALTSNLGIDSTKIGLAGHSHGGYETNYIATHSNRFATFISGSGNSDIVRSYYSFNYNFNKPFYFQFETGQYRMGTSIASDPLKYLENSPILNVDKVNAPILLWAGKKDENIVWDQVMEFFIGLKRYKKQVIALFYPHGGHSFIPDSMEEKDLNVRMLQWWDFFLKDKTDVPWIQKQIGKDAD